MELLGFIVFFGLATLAAIIASRRARLGIVTFLSTTLYAVSGKDRQIRQFGGFKHPGQKHWALKPAWHRNSCNRRLSSQKRRRRRF